MNNFVEKITIKIVYNDVLKGEVMSITLLNL